MPRVSILCALFLVACSHGDGHKPKDREPAAQGSAAASSPLSTLRDTLSPLWRADAGPQRMTNTCATAEKMTDQATAIAQAPAPAAKQREWTIETTRLVGSLVELHETCGKPDLATFEPAFARVHESFDAVAALGEQR